MSELDRQQAELEAMALEARACKAGQSGDFVPDASAMSSEPQLSGAQVCTGLVATVFALLASKRGAHWALSPEESTELGGAAGAVLDKYCPNMQGGPEISLLMVAAMVVVPRYMAEQKQVQEEGENAGAVDGD